VFEGNQDEEGSGLDVL